MVKLNMVIRTDEPVRFVGRWAWLTTIFWIVYAFSFFTVIFLGLPYGYRILSQSCGDTCAVYGQLTDANAQDLQKTGISLTTYATGYVIIFIIFALVCFGVSALLVWKKPGELVPLCAAIMMFYFVFVEAEFVFFSDLFKDYPLLTNLFTIVTFFGNLTTCYLYLTFPGGRFKLKLLFWLFLGTGVSMTLGQFLNLFVPADCSGQPPMPLRVGLDLAFAYGAMLVSFLREKDASGCKVWQYLIFALVCLAVILVAENLQVLFTFPLLLIYRTAKVLSPRERNAAKWVIYSLILWACLVLPFTFGPQLFPWLNAPGTYYFLLFNLLGFFGCGINLAGLLLAVLYANAFDINLVIKLTAVYTSLSVLIVGIYLGSVYGLQELVRNLTGQQSDLAVIGATLVSLMLFQPLRRAIQSFVDRRFYRRKYNAALTVANFNARLQDETDLKNLVSQLKEVLDETLQPEQAAIWLKKERESQRP